MVSEKKCESGFAKINECGCIVDENFAKLLDVPYNGLKFEVFSQNGSG